MTMTIDRARHIHRVRAVPLVGLAYTLSWILGLVVWAPSTTVRATGEQVLATYSGHEGVAAVQTLLTEGLPAIGLLVVLVALARTLGSRALRVVAITAAAVSVVQCVLGLTVSAWAVPGAHGGLAANLLATSNRLDGVKMLLLAVAAVLAVRAGQRGWLRWVAVALAVTITVSGIGYLLLVQSLGLAAYASLPLLLVWITGSAIVLGRTWRAAA